MVVIRLARTGAKKNPFYHIIVADKRARRDGRHIERIGYFNPVARANAIRLEMQMERIEYWLAQGAQPSERVAHLIKEMQKGGSTDKVRASNKELKKNQAAEAEKAAAAKAKAEAEAAATQAEEASAEESTEEPKSEASDATQA